MKLGLFGIIVALAAAGCVAQVGQPDEKTGTARSSLGDGLNAGGGDQGGGGGSGGGDPGGGDPPSAGGDPGATDPRSNPTSGDNQGPQPLPWDTSSTTPSGGTQQKK